MYQPRYLKCGREKLHTCLARLISEPFGGCDVHRIEGFRAALDVKADRIDHAKRVSHRPGDRRPLVNIRCNGPELQIIAAGRVWAPRCDTNGKPFVVQMTDDPSPERLALLLADGTPLIGAPIA